MDIPRKKNGKTALQNAKGGFLEVERERGSADFIMCPAFARIDARLTLLHQLVEECDDEGAQEQGHDGSGCALCGCHVGILCHAGIGFCNCCGSHCGVECGGADGSAHCIALLAGQQQVEDEEEYDCQRSGDQAQDDAGSASGDDGLDIGFCADRDGHKEGDDGLCSCAGLTEPSIQITPNKADEQRNQGGDQGVERDGSQTGCAQCNQSKEGAVVERQDRDRAGIGRVAELRGQRDVERAVRVGDGCDPNERRDAEETGGAAQCTDGQAEGNTDNKLDSGQGNALIERHTNLLDVDSRAADDEEEAHHCGVSVVEQGGYIAADLVCLGEKGCDQDCKYQRDDDQSAGDFFHAFQQVEVFGLFCRVIHVFSS